MTGGLGHGPWVAYCLPGQSGEAVNWVPSQAQKRVAMVLQAIRVSGVQVQGTAQPGAPVHWVDVGQSALEVHVRPASAGDVSVPASANGTSRIPVSTTEPSELASPGTNAAPQPVPNVSPKRARTSFDVDMANLLTG